MTNPHGLSCAVALQTALFSVPRVISAVLKAEGSIEAIFDGDRSRFRPMFGDLEAAYESFMRADPAVSMRTIEEMGEKGIHIVSIEDEAYPILLGAIYDPPAAIFVRGGPLEILSLPCVAIVGARKATAFGLDMAASIAEELAARGLVVVSGMAYGIDSAAHRGALCGGGPTIAVFGSGVDVIYPSGHAELARRIEENGLLISEFPPGTRSYPSNFPQRNRIISGLCVAAVIVEAERSSGSLITARLALEEGRDVMAVPGAAGSKMAAGTNMLIRDGAALVESGEEVALIAEERLERWQLLKIPGHFGGDVALGSPLLSFFPSGEEVLADELVRASGMQAQDVSRDLTRLVLCGLVDELPGQRFRLKER
jgi:DNA processing protein